MAVLQSRVDFSLATGTEADIASHVVSKVAYPRWSIFSSSLTMRSPSLWSVSELSHDWWRGFDGVDLVTRLQDSIGWGDGRVDSGDRKLLWSFLLHLSSILSFALIKSCLFFSREDIEMTPIIGLSLYFCNHCSLKVGGNSWVSSSWLFFI